VFSLVLDKTSSFTRLYGMQKLELEAEHDDELSVWVKGVEQFLLMELRGTLKDIRELLIHTISGGEL
jgi:hypothetical protein